MVVRLSTWSIDGHSSGSTSRALIDVHSQLSSRSMQRSLVYSRQLGQRFRDITVGLLLLRFTSRERRNCHNAGYTNRSSILCSTCDGIICRPFCSHTAREVRTFIGFNRGMMSSVDHLKFVLLLSKDVLYIIII